jgi:hypothetical protein
MTVAPAQRKQVGPRSGDPSLRKQRRDTAKRGPAAPHADRVPAPPISAADAWPIDDESDCIRQDELRRYFERKAEIRRLTEELEAERAGLVQRLADGVPIEPGPYRARLRSYLAQALTTSKLCELLGDAEVERLKEEVAPTPRIELHVTRVE